MKIEPIPPVKKSLTTDSVPSVDELIVPIEKTNGSNSFLDAETQQALDDATGILQTIVIDKISDKIIRKMPSDEYLHLLSLLDEIISGSIDKHV